MKQDCEIVRDLMPLCMDEAASEASRRMVEEHLSECPACAELLAEMKRGRVEETIRSEKREVMTAQRRAFRRRSALVGVILAGVLMVPVLVCLIVNLAAGGGLDWFFIVLAGLLTAASLSVVPLTVPAHRGLWTLGAFAASLLLLLGVCCLYSGGRWFFVASSASLFGLSVIFLPFAARRLLRGHAGIAVMAADTALYALMMVSIALFTRSPGFGRLAAAISAPVLALAWSLFAILRYARGGGWVKAGLCALVCGAFALCSDSLIGWLLAAPAPVPRFAPLTWNADTIDGNLKWLALLAGALLCAAFVTIGKGKERKEK